MCADIAPSLRCIGKPRHSALTKNGRCYLKPLNMSVSRSRSLRPTTWARLREIQPVRSCQALTGCGWSMVSSERLGAMSAIAALTFQSALCDLAQSPDRRLHDGRDLVAQCGDRHGDQLLLQPEADHAVHRSKQAARGDAEFVL